jgi:hypothetical protein
MGEDRAVERGHGITHRFDHLIGEEVELGGRDVAEFQSGAPREDRFLPRRHLAVGLAVGAIGEDGAEAQCGGCREILGIHGRRDGELGGDEDRRVHGGFRRLAVTDATRSARPHNVAVPPSPGKRASCAN